MKLFSYEILHTQQGQPVANAVYDLIESDSTLREASSRWEGTDLPASTALYALVVVVTSDLADKTELLMRIKEIGARGFPVIPIVQSLRGYDFQNAPLPAITEANAVDLNDPEAVVNALLHHGGLRRFGTGGDVMISYARADGEELAKALSIRLQVAGFRSFVDIHDVAGGEKIQRKIQKTIERADLVMLVDSRKAAESGWVAKELDMARAAHVPVLAVTRERDGYHQFRAPHIAWPHSSALHEVADEAALAARRIFASKISFRNRVARTLEQICIRRNWRLDERDRDWVATPADAEIRVKCLAEVPRCGAVIELRRRVRNGLGLLVGGTRPIPPNDAEALRELGQGKIRVAPLGQVASALADRAAAGCLRGCRVFLSAAMPDKIEAETAAHNLAPFVITFVQTMFSLGANIVFGGHPSITRMIHRAIVEIAGQDTGTIELHQGQRWIRSLPSEARDRSVFGGIHWHGEGKSIPEDLDALRSGMIAPNLNAAVFVGGKIRDTLGPIPGVIDEYDRFREACPNQPAFLLGLAGGAALSLIESQGPQGLDPLAASDLAETTDPDMATAMIVADLCESST